MGYFDEQDARRKGERDYEWGANRNPYERYGDYDEERRHRAYEEGQRDARWAEERRREEEERAYDERRRQERLAEERRWEEERYQQYAEEYYQEQRLFEEFVALVHGATECRDDLTTHYGADLIEAYDTGRTLGRRWLGLE